MRTATFALMLLCACRGEPSPRARALHAYAYEVALPQFRAFAAAADRLAASPSPEAWKAARRAWALCGTHLIGPERDRLLDAKIDTFPATPAETSDVERLGADRKGFFALEALLFGDDSRPALAAALARNLAAVAREIRDGWEHGFARALATAGERGSPFATRQEAFDRILNEVVAFAERTADRLAKPAGLVAEAEGPDASLLAARRSGEALTDIRGAVAGLRRVYDGALRGPVVRSAPDIDAALREAFDAAERDLAAIPEPLERALAARPEALRRAVGRLRTLQRRLVIDLAGVYRTTLTASPFDGD